MNPTSGGYHDNGSAGTLMANEADSRPGKYLVWGGHSLNMVFPPESLFLQSCMAVSFKGAGGLLDGKAPSISVGSLSSPLLGINAASIECLPIIQYTKI